MNEHTSKQFDAEMEGIRSGVLAMGGLVETQFRRAVEALRSPGDGDSDDDIVSLVASDERAINQMQMDIDQQCSQIIAKRQPAAHENAPPRLARRRGLRLRAVWQLAGAC